MISRPPDRLSPANALRLMVPHQPGPRNRTLALNRYPIGPTSAGALCFLRGHPSAQYVAADAELAKRSTRACRGGALLASRPDVGDGADLGTVEAVEPQLVHFAA